MTRRLLCTTLILSAILFLGSCDKHKDGAGDGGSQTDPAQSEATVDRSFVIQGLSTVSSRGQTTYRAVVSLKRTVLSDYQWEIQGHAAIVGSANASTVTVQIEGPGNGGEFTLSLKAKKNNRKRVAAPDFKVAVSPFPLLRVVVHYPVTGSLSPTDLTGEDGRVYATATSKHTIYNYWSLHFVGNTTTFPDLVNVQVSSWSSGADCYTYWALHSEFDKIYLDFPKQGGGTVGFGGTVYSTGNRPYFRNEGGFGDTNFLFLLADGVQNMAIQVMR